MNDKNLYTQILGISSPWVVSKVDLNIENEENDIEISYESAKGICPECGAVCSIHDHREERRWRHLDSCQMRTYIVSKIPRCIFPFTIEQAKRVLDYS